MAQNNIRFEDLFSDPNEYRRILSNAFLDLFPMMEEFELLERELFLLGFTLSDSE